MRSEITWKLSRLHSRLSRKEFILRAMQTSANGRKLIESAEGLRLDAYQDQRGKWTIGYGSTQGVTEGMTITQEEADARLAIDLQTAEAAVITHVHAPLGKNQFDALVSLAYNIGSGNFGGSTLVRLLNDAPPDYVGAANQFLVWCRTAGQVNQGLLNRRNAERALFTEAE